MESEGTLEGEGGGGEKVNQHSVHPPSLHTDTEMDGSYYDKHAEIQGSQTDSQSNAKIQQCLGRENSMSSRW